MMNTATATIRQHLFAQRKTFNTTTRTQVSTQICHHIQQLIRPLSPQQYPIVALFYPMADEINCLPLVPWLNEHGYQTCLPVTAPILQFYPWQLNEAVKKAAFGVYEPLNQSLPVLPDLLIVPMLGYSPQGDRIGYGKGYYDRALAYLHRHAKAQLTIGVAYESTRLPAHYQAQAHDIRMDYIVTEKTIYTCQVSPQQANP